MDFIFQMIHAFGGSWLQCSIQIYILANTFPYSPDISWGWIGIQILSISLSFLNIFSALEACRRKLGLMESQSIFARWISFEKNVSDLKLLILFPIIAYRTDPLLFSFLYIVLYVNIFILFLTCYCVCKQTGDFNQVHIGYLIYLPLLSFSFFKDFNTATKANFYLMNWYYFLVGAFGINTYHTGDVWNIPVLYTLFLAYSSIVLLAYEYFNHQRRPIDIYVVIDDINGENNNPPNYEDCVTVGLSCTKSSLLDQYDAKENNETECINEKLYAIV